MARIAIAGGSIGGLTVACLLRDAGHDVTLFERSPTELKDRGAGIVCLEATARYLTERIGVAIDDFTIRTDHVRYLGRDNRTIFQQDHSYRFSSWTTVYRHLLQAFDRERYRLGHDMTGWSADGDAIELRFAHGGSHRADLLVCADGVGSSARKSLQPDAAPRYAGYVAWRGTLPESDLEPALAARLSEAITYHVAANSHILVYPIPGMDGSVAKGERLINYVWYRNYLDGGDLDHLLTDRDGRHRPISLPPSKVAEVHQEEVRAVARARLPADFADIIERTPELFLQVIYDITVERMAFGRVCLLGDAAFLARPHAGAGSAKAAEDGWALTSALAEAPTIDEALRSWEKKQLGLGRALVLRTRDIGRRSQVDNCWIPSDPDLMLGLRGPGD
jgi:2,6-dihydroxypyridine 3-monooxygenase